MSALKIKIALKNVSEKVNRHVFVPADLTFQELHEIIQIVFQWNGYHLANFEVRSREVRSFVELEYEPDKFDDLLSSTIDKERKIADFLLNFVKYDIEYTYDFKDNWEHRITLLKGDVAENVLVPVVIQAQGDSYVEDSEEEVRVAFDMEAANEELRQKFSQRNPANQKDDEEFCAKEIKMFIEEMAERDGSDEVLSDPLGDLFSYSDDEKVLTKKGFKKVIRALKEMSKVAERFSKDELVEMSVEMTQIAKEQLEKSTEEELLVLIQTSIEAQIALMKIERLEAKAREK